MDTVATNQNVVQTNKTKNIWLGIGIGVTAGCTIGSIVGYSVGVKKERKRSRDEIRRARRRAYDEAIEESKKWIAENVLIIEDDSPEAFQKAIEERSKALNEEKCEKTSNEASSEALSEDIQTTSNGQKSSEIEILTDDIYAEKTPAKETTTEEVPPDDKDIPKYIEREGMIEFTCNGKRIGSYPKDLFYDENGYSLGEVQTREKIRNYEHDLGKLRKIWQAMGWGEYYPDYDAAPSAEEINNWDVEIEDFSGEKLGDEPYEKTIAREKYLDELERYTAKPESAPHIISQREFDEECYLDKTYVNYYDVDNVFLDSTDVDSPVDAFRLFGVVNGNDLFGKYDDEDEEQHDPDIVWVKNFHENVVAEVTRYHKSSTGITDGSAYLNGISN